MKKVVKFLIICVLGAALMSATESSKLWVSIEDKSNHDRVIFIQDRETGTRCYAVTNNEVNVSGYAISCVPKEAK